MAEEKRKELAARREDIRWQLRISDLNNTFQNFVTVKGTSESFTLFRELAAGNTDWKMLLCYGGVGNGKTHLCEALSIELYQKGQFTPVLTMASMMGYLKSTMHTESISNLDTMIHRYSTMDQLILDDVGMGGSGSDWEWGQLEDIIARRYRENLLTALTSNLDIDQLEQRSKRIVSRFRDKEKARLVLNEGADYRRRKDGK